MADLLITLVYNDSDQILSIDRYQDGQLAVEGDYSYDGYGRLIGLVYHQGETVLNSYTWTYSGGGLSQFSGTENGTVPFTASGPSPLSSLLSSLWKPTGGLMPIHDTTGVTDALASGSLSSLDLLTSCTSADGTAYYTYDPTGQLIGAHYSNPQSPIPNPSNEFYSYDANGNRVTANGSSYTTGPGNRLLSDGTYYYAYDAEGNRIARFVDVDADGVLDAGDTDISQCAWDARNRLTEVVHYATYAALESQLPDQVVDYLYDVENRWIGQTIDSDGDGQIDHQTRFAYEGDQIALQFDRVGAGEVIGADLSHRYLWQPDAVDHLMADDQVATPSRPGNVVWPLSDDLGTVRDLAIYNAQTGVTSVTNHRVYGAFGSLKSQTSAAVDCVFGFTGRPKDDATGLQNNSERVYDPTIAGWLKSDPIGFTAGDTNLYRYVGNSPTNAVDPDGLEVYIVGRVLSVFGGQNANQVGYLVPSHEFVAVIDENGILHTYSWGNDYTSDNPSHWYKDQVGDLTASFQALYHPWLNLFCYLSVEGGHSLDPYIKEAYDLLKGAGARSPSEVDPILWTTERGVIVVE